MAFDLELVMQQGCRVFKTDEAILSPDWVSNECIIAVYDAHQRQFYHFNRAYSVFRKHYNEKINDHTADSPEFEESQITQLNRLGDQKFDDFCENVGRGKIRSFPGKDGAVEGIMRETETKEGGTSEELKGYSRNAFMGVSNVPQLRSNASRSGEKETHTRGEGMLLCFMLSKSWWIH